MIKVTSAGITSSYQKYTIESTVNRNYTLGEFLNIWGQNFDGKTVKMTLNGKLLTDFRDYILRDGEPIKLEVQ